jgi:CubicO group peptidase (beta-lactamase class C family)
MDLKKNESEEWKMTDNGFPQQAHTLSRRSFLGLTGLTAASLLAGCFPAAWPASPTRPAPTATRPSAYFPTGEWRTSTPEEQGLDSQQIARLLAKIAQSAPYMHSFILIRNGTLVTEAYFAPITRDLGHFLFSATKSVTSALVGIAIQEGFIKGVDQKIIEFFPELQAKSTSEHLGQLTVEHLLTMSTGHVDFMSPTPYQQPPVDWVEKFLTDKTNTLIDPPGRTFLYTSGAPHTLSAVIQRTTGKTASAYAAEKLFGPLGIRDFTWLADQNGISFGNSWLRLKPLDMAKFGYLYLNQGLWDGQQIIPQAWVEKSTQKHIETKQAMFNSAEKDGYGYLWWMNGFGGYAAHGYGGQFIFVIPESNVVAVFTGGFDDSVFDTGYQLMQTYIIPAIHPAGPLARNDPAQQALAAAVDQAGHPSPKAVPPLPGTAQHISGKVYQFPDGTQFTLSFDGTAQYALKVTYPPGAYGQGNVTLDYQGGLDDQYRLNNSLDGVYGPFILGIKGQWTDASTFVQFEYVTDNISNRIITCHYQNGRLTINIRDDISGKSTYDVSMEAKVVN